ncbi:uncharacterized protein [Aegilops tauschii subsp. strangulata]|uniref:uncharacterized protein n=1 Tax=Aegilops tauschii subsp. strangulata TaxID=200361 RepID=UPI00098B1CBB|nr:uncharacterized protein LOC109752259 [Aegilops tauschii subsp. strangulata]
MTQKLFLALLVASRKLCHYFQGYPIKVVSAYTLERVLRIPNAAGRLGEWNVELQAFQLEFSTTRIIKGATLSDFVVEWTDFLDREGTGDGVVLISPTQDKLYYTVQLCFQHGEKVSNNIAEYEGLIAGLKAVAALRPPPPAAGPASLQEELPPAPFSGASACGPASGARLLLALEPQEGCWIEELKAYLLQGTLPGKEEDAEREARQATAYCIQDAELHRKGPNDVSLRCISREQGCELLADIDGGDCGHHSSSCTLVGKAFRSGFYRPTALNDATELVISCDACQFHAKQIRQPTQGLQTIPLSWSFMVWGLDILGPFPRAPGGYRYLYITIDKNTKWAEVEVVRTIPAISTVKFIKGLVSRFKVPNRIITNNGSQFTSNLFNTYSAKNGTQICYASVAHP